MFDPETNENSGELSAYREGLRPILSKITYKAMVDRLVDLEFLAGRWIEAGVHYIPRKFCRIHINYGDGVTVRIFRRGSIVIDGKLTPMQAREVMDEIVEKMSLYMGRRFGYRVVPHTSSIVAYGRLPFQVDMWDLLQRYHVFAKTNSGSMAWSHLQMFGITRVGVTYTGYLKFCGAKSFRDLQIAYDELYKLLLPFERYNH